MVRFFILALFLFGCSGEAPEQMPDIKEDDKIIEDTDMIPPKPVYDIPNRSKPYIDLLKLSDNPSRHAAQIDQESNFNPLAKSPYAYGIAQFTPPTGKWAASTFCKDLGPFQKYNAEWGLKCSIRYMKKLQSNNDYGSYCHNRQIAEQEYNGGNWIIWEITHAGSYEGAEKVCGNETLKNGRKRAAWACKENYEYPKRINQRQIEFKDLGGILCKF